MGPHRPGPAPSDRCGAPHPSPCPANRAQSTRPRSPPCRLPQPRNGGEAFTARGLRWGGRMRRGGNEPRGPHLAGGATRDVRLRPPLGIAAVRGARRRGAER